MAEKQNLDPFQQEILGLFAAEAQEWISQIETALRELESGPAQFRCTKLFQTVRNGITNLGGSAATVELTDIEQRAFALLPHLEAIEAQGRVTSPGQCAALRESLEVLAGAVQRLIQPAAAPAAATEGAARPAGAAAAAPPVAPPPAAQPAASLSGPALDALLELQQSRAESADATKNLIASLIQQSGKAGQAVVTGDRATILRIMKELEALDAQLFADVQQRLPNIQKAFSGLKAEGAASFVSNGSLEGVLQDIGRLREEAFAAGASPVMLFFKGLHSFLSLVARQRITVPPQRLDAVESRLGTVLTMTQQWVEIGRMKKANVEQFMGT